MYSLINRCGGRCFCFILEFFITAVLRQDIALSPGGLELGVFSLYLSCCWWAGVSYLKVTFKKYSNVTTAKNIPLEV